MSAVVKSLASSNSGSFAVCGGGHTWVPGAASSPGGVTIDLRGLDSVELSADRSTVSVGAGATWYLVYDKLDRLGMSVAGGVGVSGLTLDGGLLYFGTEHGWTPSQAASFEVVLVDGSTADAQQNRDLWKELRGGGNGFGVVTAINLVTLRQGWLWSARNPTASWFDRRRVRLGMCLRQRSGPSAKGARCRRACILTGGRRTRRASRLWTWRRERWCGERQ